jgi:hypothetical protein
MAEESKGITEKTSEGLKDAKKFATKHYLVAAVILGIAVFLAIRYRSKIVSGLAGVLPSWANKALNISTTAAAMVLGVLFSSRAAEAATCCAEPLTSAVSSGGGIIGVLSALGAVLASALGVAMFGIVAFGAPDTVEAKMAKGGKTATFNMTDAEYATSGPSFDFFVDGSSPMAPDGKKPLVATDQVVEVATTFENISTGTNPIYDDDLARCVKSVKLHSELLGTIQDDTVGTGPIIKHLIEFIGMGFNRGADAPVATIAVPTVGGPPIPPNDVSYTRYFTIPHAQRFLVNPLASALWLGLINDMKITVQIAGANCLDSVSTGANIRGNSTLKVTTSVTPYNIWHWPLLAQWILEQPLAGSRSVKLLNFGQKNAAGSEPIDYVHTIALLSNLSGLPGNMALDNLLELQCPKLGLVKVENVPAFFKTRLEAQVYGRSSAGYDNGNFQDGAVATGMNLGDAKFLLLREAGLDMLLDNMLKVANGYQLPIDSAYTATPNTTPHAYALGSMRFFDPSSVGAAFAKRSGGNLSASDRMASKPAQ